MRKTEYKSDGMPSLLKNVIAALLRKIGNWISKLKTTFTQLQNDITEIEDTVEKEISFEQDLSKKNNDDGKK